MEGMPEAIQFPLAMEAFDNRLPEGTGRICHTHGGNELQLVLDPGTTVIQAGKPVPAPPGTLVLHRPDEEHGYLGDGAPTRMLVINYEPDPAWEAGLPCFAARARRVWHLDDQQMAAYVDLFTRLQLEMDGERSLRQYASGAWLRQLLVMIARMSEPKAATPRATAAALGPVDEDVHRLRRAIDLRRQGSASGALQGMVENYDALRHRFRRTYGESPGRMLARLRVEKAKTLLTTSDLSMAAIAGQVGYARQHEFARAFHRVVGCTPTAYRRQYKGR